MEEQKPNLTEIIKSYCPDMSDVVVANFKKAIEDEVKENDYADQT